MKHVSFQNVNNHFKTEFPIRKITITTASATSSGLRPQIPPRLTSIVNIEYTVTFLHLIPHQFILERSIIPLKWRSESIVNGNSVHNRKKISVLKISAEERGLIFLLWEITCKKYPVIFYETSIAHGPHVLWCHRKLVYCKAPPESWHIYYFPNDFWETPPPALQGTKFEGRYFFH